MTDATSTPLACPCCAYPLPASAGSTHRCSECGAVIDAEALRAVPLRLACPCCAYPLPVSAGATHRCSECGAMIDAEALRAIPLHERPERVQRALTTALLTPVSVVVVFGLLIPVARTSEFIQQWFVPIMLTLDAAIVVIPVIISFRHHRRDGLAYLMALGIVGLSLVALLCGFLLVTAATNGNTHGIIVLLPVFIALAVTVILLSRWFDRQCLRWDCREVATTPDDAHGSER